MRVVYAEHMNLVNVSSARVGEIGEYTSRLLLAGYNQIQYNTIDSLRISHNASGMGANIRVLVT